MTVISSTLLVRSVFINVYLWDVVNSWLLSYHSLSIVSAIPPTRSTQTNFYMIISSNPP